MCGSIIRRPQDVQDGKAASLHKDLSLRNHIAHQSQQRGANADSNVQQKNKRSVCRVTLGRAELPEKKSQHVSTRTKYPPAASLNTQEHLNARESYSMTRLHSHSRSLCTRCHWAAALVGDGSSGLARDCSSSGVTGANGLFFGLVSLGLVGGGLSDGLSILLVLVDGPVKDVVVLEAFTDKEVAEDLAEVRVVGLVVEAERARVVEVDGKLVGEATAQDFGRGRHLLLHDAVVLLLLSSSLQTLPGERATAEVEHDVTERLHVVTTRLLDTQVGVDTSVTSSTGQVLVLTVWNVEVSLGVTVLLGQAKVNNIDLVSTLANAHEEVVGLDVAVDERLGVNVLDAGDELIGQEEDRLERELAVAEVEEILERRAEEVKDHGVVVTLGAEPADKGDADTASEGLVDAGLVFELRVLGLDAFEFDGNLLAGDDVGACRRRRQWGEKTR
jgi:hypothetical protein